MARLREALYREVADIEVDVSTLSPDAVADAILAAIGVDS
jgi:hypothetical protein